jgi:hypothetical protein
MMQQGEMKQTFVDQGLLDVTETQLMIRMDYQSFEDYCAPKPLGRGKRTHDARSRAAPL